MSLFISYVFNLDNIEKERIRRHAVMGLRKKKTEQLIFGPTMNMTWQVTNTLPFYFDKNIKHLRPIKYSSKQASCHIYDPPKVT